MEEFEIVKQPTRSKRVTKERRFDRTQLRAGGHGRTVHRDYEAHYLRWNFVVQELNKPMEEALKFWAAGLIDGEGSFDIRVILKADGEDRNSIQFIFQLGLRDDDGETIDLLRNVIGVGSVSFEQNKRITNAKPIKILSISTLDDCLVLRDLLLDAPLRSKKAADFDTWAEALTRFAAHKDNEYHLTDELLEEMRMYQIALREGRRYTPKELLREKRNYSTDVFFRWGWVSRQMRQGQSILDVGCGQDQPLLYILGSRIQTVPDIYVGVDLNNIPNKSHVKWADIYDNFDFVSKGVEFLEPKYTPFDKAVCFEVIEHMQPPDGRRLLDNIYRLLRPGGVLYLSTPVFNGSAAANHLHEYTIPELREAVEAVGYKVQRRLGTFASKPEIKPVLNTCQTQLYDEMEEWFGGDVMSTIFAYNHPDQSRNNLWVLEKPA